jgi:hypothetical protein
LRCLVVEGPSKGLARTFAPSRVVTIGRSEEADLCIDDAKISRIHCRVRDEDGDWVLEDMHSRNGTWLGGEKVGEHPLGDGDRFTLGKETTVEVRFVAVATTPVPPPAPAAAAATRRSVVFPPKRGGATPTPVPPPAPVGAHAAGSGNAETMPPLEGPLAGLPGSSLGELRVLEQVHPLGRAVFFRALQPSLNRHVMVEVFTPEEMAVAGAREAVVRGVQSAARLLHPNILQIFDMGEDRGFTFVTMELFQGRNLGRILGEKGFVPIGNALALARQLAEAFACGVDGGAPVGAVSPNDMWVGDTGTLKVKFFREPGCPPPPVAHAAYRAPEVLGGGDPTDPRAAVYSVGALLYHMLAATPPVHGATREEIARRARHDTPPPLRRVNIKVTALLAKVVEQALAKDPAARQDGLRLLLRDLQRVTAPTL